MKYRLKSDRKTGYELIMAGGVCAVLALVPLKFVLLIAAGLLAGTGLLICSQNK